MCLEPRRQRGFTLIELMIVVAVVGLLAVVAVPSYQSSVRKAHRTEAKAALVAAAQMMERYMTEKSTYESATLGTGGVYPALSENGYYALSLATTASSFTLTAEPQGNQGADSCGTFTLTQAGVRAAAGGAAECW